MNNSRDGYDTPVKKNHGGVDIQIPTEDYYNEGLDNK